jgi:hypothetical protein
MNALTEREFEVQAKKYFWTVFAGIDPYDEPFQPYVFPRLLLFPYRWQLDIPWINPLKKTMRFLGEEGFFVSALHRPPADEQPQPYHWYVPITEMDRYGSLVVSQVNAVYSINGTWGVICSDEDHAIIGGPELLIANIQEAVTDFDVRIKQFIDMWKYYHQKNGVSIQWLFSMLSHIYGADVAKNILSQNDLNDLIK